MRRCGCWLIFDPFYGILNSSLKVPLLLYSNNLLHSIEQQEFLTKLGHRTDYSVFAHQIANVGNLRIIEHKTIIFMLILGSALHSLQINGLSLIVDLQ